MKLLLVLAILFMPATAYAMPPEYTDDIKLDVNYPPVRSLGWTLFRYQIPKYKKTYEGMTNQCWHGQIRSNPHADGEILQSPGWYRFDEERERITVFADTEQTKTILKQVCMLVD